jgi:hypothetical protein
MDAYAKRNPHHHGYHYTDVPFEEKGYTEKAVGATPEDIVHILPQAIAVLSGKTRAAENPHAFTTREALFLVLHLTGDVHQPLHVGAAYIDRDDEFVDPKSPSDLDSGKVAGTEGGNWLLLGSRNLHAMWDTDYVQKAMRRERVTTPNELAEALIENGYKKPSDGGNMDGWGKKWANETIGLARGELEPVTLEERSEVEGGGKAHSQWTISLPRAYTTKATVQVEKQLFLAGYRVAELLKTVWPE